MALVPYAERVARMAKAREARAAKGKYTEPGSPGWKSQRSKCRVRYTLPEVEKVFAKELKLKKDWLAEIANAVFVGNREQIYLVLSRAITQDNPNPQLLKVLAERVFGLPKQEIGFSQDSPFHLVIEHVDGDAPQTLTIEGVTGPRYANPGRPPKALVAANAAAKKDAADPPST
jgi:hypothetical protein